MLVHDEVAIQVIRDQRWRDTIVEAIVEVGLDVRNSNPALA